MRPHSVAKSAEESGWRSRSESIKVGSDQQNSATVSSDQLNVNSVSRGIIRIRVSINSDPLQIQLKDKDDDDADSAISVETSDDSLINFGLSRSSPPLSIRQNADLDDEKMSKKYLSDESDDECQRRFHQRRLLSTKRANSITTPNLAKTKSQTQKQQNGEGRHQLTASSGASTLPAWKLRKAMKNFKMGRLVGDSSPDAAFGAPHIQYFLASLCDHPASTLVNAETKTSLETNNDDSPMEVGLRARCPLVAEVRKLVSKLRSSQPVNAQGFQLSVAVTVLKEFLNGIPGGVFGELTEEFYQISLESSLELTIMYLHSILHEMPYVVQQFTYLLCKALRNLIRLTGGSSLKNYTDLLMHFTPVLFSSSVGDIDKFLRAARLLLVMVDDCERVFLPLPWLDANGNWCWHNGDFEDETFFRQIFDSLQNLEARLATDDSGVESEPEEPSSSGLINESLSGRRSLSGSVVDFYQVVYLDDAADDYSPNDVINR